MWCPADTTRMRAATCPSTTPCRRGSRPCLTLTHSVGSRPSGPDSVAAMAAPPRSADARLATLGTVAAAIAVTSWGIGPVVVKDTDLGGLAVAFYRLSLGAVLMVVIHYGTGRRLRWRTLVGAVPGGLAFGFDILLFFTAVKWTTVADATVISA